VLTPPGFLFLIFVFAILYNCCDICYGREDVSVWWKSRSVLVGSGTFGPHPNKKGRWAILSLVVYAMAQFHSVPFLVCARLQLNPPSSLPDARDEVASLDDPDPEILSSQTHCGRCFAADYHSEILRW
jgi:hypothetical protein